MANMFRTRTKKKTLPRIVGAVRQTQLVSTFGIGSIVDFVDETVVIAGVDNWDDQDDSRKIQNENLQALTNKKYFLQPKTEEPGEHWRKSADIPAFRFPEMLYCPVCKKLIHAKEVQYLPNVHRCPLRNAQGKPCNTKLVASRFIVVCENGHMEDFPYSWWVHKGGTCPASDCPRILMYNVDNRSDVDSLMLQCEACNTIRPMAGAFQEYAFSGENGYSCCGYHPHLPIQHQTPEDQSCPAPLKTRLRSSSGTYFPVTQSALSIPPWSKQAVQIVQKKMDVLKYMPESNALAYIRAEIYPKVSIRVGVDELVRAYYLLLKHNEDACMRTEADIYSDEYKVLSQGIATDDDEYSARTVPFEMRYGQYIKKIVAVDKLTVVQALCGFTRLHPWDGGNLEDVRIIPLSSTKKDWLPAVKLRGEGIFIEFDQHVLDEWSKNCFERYSKMGNRLEESYFENDRFSPQYVFLHTFSHLFARQLSEVCGYSLASISEKIYSTFNVPEGNGAPMCGILIYLATSDSEGSLGGLISVAENKSLLDQIIQRMLKRALWCSADPLCVSSEQQGYASLNYAACHDCTLLPETSCEFRNILLDRVAVVGTPDNRTLGVLGELASQL